MRLWRDTGEAIQEAMLDQRVDDKVRFGLFQPLWRFLPFVRITRQGNVYGFWPSEFTPPGLGAPDIVIFDDPPLDLRDVAE